MTKLLSLSNGMTKLLSLLVRLNVLERVTTQHVLSKWALYLTGHHLNILWDLLW